MALNRTLVLPRMAALCECFFYPGKNCTIEGHRVRLPHVMPTDHWLRPRRLALPHREPGFLDNPRFPAAVRDGAKLLEPCADDTPCGAHDGGVRVPPRSSDTSIRERLVSVSTAPVVRVLKPIDVFGSFQRDEDARALHSALEGVLGAFCCIANTDKARFPTAETLQVPYAWDGAPEPVDNASPDAARCGA